ncbi:unnamed protein product [Mytilus edulis]|uniref:Uncharacterized protein n=1 Tax=Mytilus edulis TaxID=6550 RepID=A0A8S3UPB6_MYTED|nr:unnamed protein product [Mytilus edulis]
MSVTKILKERKKFYSKIRGAALDRETYLFTDSKGVGLQEYTPNSVKGNFNVIYKRGATIENKHHIEDLLQKLKSSSSDNPIVYICTVLCIDCPYYSITRANNKYAIRKEGNERPKPNKKPSLVINKFKKNRVVQLSTEIDNQVCNQVDYYNRQIKLINRNTATPRLSQDLIISNKSKKDRRVRYRKNYNLLQDGVHPTRTIAKLWIYKLIDLALELSEDRC